MKIFLIFVISFFFLSSASAVDNSKALIKYEKPFDVFEYFEKLTNVEGIKEHVVAGFNVVSVDLGFFSEEELEVFLSNFKAKATSYSYYYEVKRVVEKIKRG